MKAITKQPRKTKTAPRSGSSTGPESTATGEWQQPANPIAGFIADCFDVGRGLEVALQDILKAYDGWCARTKERSPLDRSSLIERLQAQFTLEPDRTDQVSPVVQGLNLRPGLKTSAMLFRESQRLGSLALLREVHQTVERFGYLKNRYRLLAVAAELLPAIEGERKRRVFTGSQDFEAYMRLFEEES